MSHYSLVKCKFTRKSAIVKALQRMGFKAHMIEQFDKAQPLKGYQGDNRQQKAHIRIKGSGWSGQNYVGGASNDLGFEQLEDGSFQFHVSNYDSMKYNNKWVKNLEDQYAIATVEEVAEENDWALTQQYQEEDGTMYIRLETQY